MKDLGDGRDKISEHGLEQAIYPYATLLMHAIAHFPLIDGRVKLSFSWYDVSYRKKVASAPPPHPPPRNLQPPIRYWSAER